MLLPSFIINEKGDLHRMALTMAGGNDLIYETFAFGIAALCAFGLFSNLILLLVTSFGWPARRKNHWTCYLQMISILEIGTLLFLSYRYLNEFYWHEAPNIFFTGDFSCRLLSYMFSWIRMVDNWLIVALTIDSYMAMFTTLRLFGGEIGDRRIGWLIVSIIGIGAALILIPDVVLVHLFDARSSSTAARLLSVERRFAAGIPITDSCWSGVVPYEIGYRLIGAGLIVGFIIPFCCVLTMDLTIAKYSGRQLYRKSAQARHGRQFLGVTMCHMLAQLPMACFSVYSLIVRYINPTQADTQIFQLVEFVVYELLPMLAYCTKLYFCVIGSAEFRKCCCCTATNKRIDDKPKGPNDDGIRRLGGLLSIGPQHHSLLEEQDISDVASTPKKNRSTKEIDIL